MNPERERDNLWYNTSPKRFCPILNSNSEDRTLGDKSAFEVRRQHMRNSDNFPISSDSDGCISEFGGTAYSRGKKSSNPAVSWFHRKERRFRMKVRHMIKTSYFYWTILTLIFMNTIFMCSVHHNQPEYWESFLYYAEFVFLGFFGIELLLKVITLIYLVSDPGPSF